MFAAVLLISATSLTNAPLCFAMFEEQHDCIWKNLQSERVKSKLNLETNIYPEQKSEAAYEGSDFELRMNLYGAYRHSNLSGANSAAVIEWLLKYAEVLDRARSPLFGAVVADINNRVQNLSTEEQNKALPIITWFPGSLLLSDRELAVIPLVYTVINLCAKNGITPDTGVAERLRGIGIAFGGDWDDVTPDARRSKCVLDVTKKSAELFDKLAPVSSQATYTHERLARLYEENNLRRNAIGEYLKVLALNDKGAKGEISQYNVLRALIENCIKEKQPVELADSFQKYKSLITESDHAYQLSQTVEELLKTGLPAPAQMIAVHIFPLMEWEPKPVVHETNALQTIGCQFTPRYYFQPSWRLALWLSFCSRASGKAQAQALYDKCIAAAIAAKKQNTAEFKKALTSNAMLSSTEPQYSP